MEKQMSEQHNPGPWYVAQVLNQRTLKSSWYVARNVGPDRDRLMDSKGRVQWFTSGDEAFKAAAALSEHAA
jgi:hypothetical protein